LIGADPDLVVSCVEVAVIVAVPVKEAAVNTPESLTLPISVGLTDHLTSEPLEPVPVTVAVHGEVCVNSMDVGKHLTVTEVMGDATVTLAEPDFVAS
jgi:hypothetical protein